MTQWAMEHGVTIVATFIDTVSGSTPTEIRPGWTAALDALRHANAGVFLVAKRDRIGRDSLHVALAGRAVTMAGATLTSADGSGNGASAADALMRTVLDAVSQYELSCIRTRTREALAAKRAQGNWAPPVAPYGLRREAGRLVPDDHELRVLEAARGHRAAGLSLAATCVALEEQALFNRAGRRFARETLCVLLRRPVAA